MDTVIITPVGETCNLACSYCYQKDLGKDIQARMTEDTLAQTIRQVLGEFGSVIRFIWHGGEPLIAGVPFFRAALKLQEEYRQPGQTLFNTVTTNGTLLTPELANLFSSFRVRIDISLDGPPAVHNLHRLQSNGEGSYERTWTGLELARDAGILGETLVTVTSQTVTALDQTFSFLLQNRILNFDLSPCLQTQDRKTTTLTLKEEQYPFLMQLFQRWWDLDDPAVKARPFWGVAERLLGGDGLSCPIRASGRNRILGVEWDGSLFPCYQYAGRPDWYFGKITEGPMALRKAMGSQRYRTMRREMRRLPEECVSCQWKDFCLGGCPAHRQEHITASPHEFYFCELYRQLFVKGTQLIKGGDA